MAIITFVREIHTGVPCEDGMPGTGRAPNEWAVVRCQAGEFLVELQPTTNHDDAGFEYRPLTAEERALPMLVQVPFVRGPKENSKGPIEHVPPQHLEIPYSSIWLLCQDRPDGYGRPLGMVRLHEVEIFGEGIYLPEDAR